MSDNFNNYIDLVLKNEGGYVNDSRDRGGETNFGITVATARAFGYEGAMSALTREQAVEIYRARYWVQPGYDRIDAFSPKIALRLLDIGVNTGPSTGGKFVQRALNVLNQNGTLYQDITVDGQVGAMTRACILSLLRQRGKDGERVLLGMIMAQLSVYYIEITEKRPTNEAFQFGWQLNRALGQHV